MLDIKFIRENLELVKEAVKNRQSKVNVDELIKKDDERKSIQTRIEMLKAEANKIAKEGQKSERGGEIKQMLKDLEPQLSQAQENYKLIAVQVPNIPQEDVPVGTSEKDNKVLKEVGEIKLEEGKDHVALGTQLDLIDIDRAVKISGNRFYYIKNELAELEFALIRYVLDIVKKEGFQPIIPPILIKEDIAWGTGHFEAINDDAYHMKNDELVAVGTSEQSVVPYFAGETIDKTQRFISFSTCLRREAGSYGKDVKGILRVHQFDKIEMVVFCSPENSHKEHELIISLEEKIMSGLGLPYRLVALCTGEIGLPSAKTIDVETWMPGQKQYRETHSSSNCTDFQARRLNIKFKNGDKVNYAHILNGTAIAMPRALIAIMENYQSFDSAQDELIIKVPEVLQKYVDFKEIRKK